jgi:hypothetical protein
MNADGTGLQQLTSTGFPVYNTFQPAWSPDGAKIVFAGCRPSGGCGIFTINTDGTGTTKIPQTTSGDYEPAWSPDGGTIAFERGYQGELHIIHPDGTGDTDLGPGFAPSWSPSGTKIAFTVPGANYEIYVANADGSGRVNLTNNPASDTDPAWSPDGSRIAFATSRSGQTIFTMKADGSGQTGVPGLANGYLPDWQPLSTASYPKPQSASPLQVSLVPLFRQCGTGAAPVNGKHSPPLGTGSCNPPSPNSTVARVGSTSQGSAQLTAIPGDSDPTNGNQADLAIAVHLSDVLATAGGDYNPNPSGADLTEVTRLRLSDRANNYGGASGTAGDLDYPVAVDCTTTGGPEGASCDATTSANAITPGAIEEQRGTIAQVFRIRLYDAGSNGVRENGTGDDRILAHQGIYIP